MKNRPKDRAKVEIESIHLHQGDWVGSDFVINKVIYRSDLTQPDVKPSFIVRLTNKDRVLVGWTTKGQQRLFHIKEMMPGPAPIYYTLKLIRMRGPQWQKVTKIVKRAMVRWFQGENFYSLGDYSNLKMPVIKSYFPKLLANDIISVQPMSQPTSSLFHLNYNVPKQNSIFKNSIST